MVVAYGKNLHNVVRKGLLHAVPFNIITGIPVYAVLGGQLFEGDHRNGEFYRTGRVVIGVRIYAVVVHGKTDRIPLPVDARIPYLEFIPVRVFHYPRNVRVFGLQDSS